MSYSKSFTQRISVPYKGSETVSLPDGGTKTVYYSGTAYEDVTVNVEVDTLPFEISVANTNNNVNGLTGAVAATEVAEVAAIEMGSKKVANTIVSGFYSLIRSDLSQQVMELSKKIESKLYYLKELGKRCADKKRQLEGDYNRLAGNYTKIFADLNSELDHRVRELNKPVFLFRKECVEQTDRMSNNDLVSTVSVFGVEESALHAQIQASFVKKRAADAIESANRFLVKQKNTANTIDKSMVDCQFEGDRYVPICFVETVGESMSKDRIVYQPQIHPLIDSRQLIDQLTEINWKKMDVESKDAITRFFNQEIATHFNASSIHEKRVKDTLLKLFSNNTLI